MKEASEVQNVFPTGFKPGTKKSLILVMIYFWMCQKLIPNDFLKLYRELVWKNKESREFLKKKDTITNLQ